MTAETKEKPRYTEAQILVGELYWQTERYKKYLQHMREERDKVKQALVKNLTIDQTELFRK